MQVRLVDDKNNFIGCITILETGRSEDGKHADYTVTAEIDHGGPVLSVHRHRIHHFPSKALNHLALVSAALRVLPTDAFGADDDSYDRTGEPADTGTTQATVPTDLERRLNRAMSALPPRLG